MERDILLNETPLEVEILEFRVGGNSYGIDINDVREILPYKTKPTFIPNSHPYIEGIIMPRDFIIPIINGEKSLKVAPSDELKQEMLIVTSIMNLNIGLHVDSVKGIHRTMNTEITKPGKKLTTPVKGLVIGVLNRGDHKIEIIELRKIITEINPEVNVG